VEKIYLTSDPHFCHNREFIYKPRGFNSADEMNEAIVTNFNSIVKPEDTVYILGDCMLNDDEKGIELLKSLNGHIYIALGNHDTGNRVSKYLDCVEDVRLGYRFRYKKIEFWLSHYPMMMKNFDDPKPVWNLSGHTHSKDKFENGKYNVYNVALDAHDNKPVSLDQIMIDIRQYMQQEKEEIASHTQELKCDKCIEFPYYCSGGFSCPPGLKYRRDPPDGGYYG
jgi:calcineurin-like phosphoesterase family protein